MKRITRAECANCGVEGPEGQLVKGALEAAALKGWLIGDRPHSRKDYCPSCRGAFEPKPCVVRHDKGKQSTAIYLITAPGRSLYVCGKHSQGVQSELFASGVEELKVARTHASRRGRPYLERGK